MGYVQEERAESAVAALRALAAAHAHVIRGGDAQACRPTDSCPATSWSSKRATRLPPMRASIQSTSLQTGEASLTGESVPVAKDVEAIAAEVGSRRSRQHDLQRDSRDLRPRAGRGGRDRHAHRDGAHRRHAGGCAGRTTPLQKELDRVGRMLGLVVVIIAVVMIATIPRRARPRLLGASSTC